MRFVIHNHHASHHHYDLRMEVPLEKGMLDIYKQKRTKETPEPLPVNKEDKSVLLSFAIPKHDIPSGNKKLLAVMTEPHPIEYIDFAKDKQEVIPEGSYGAGKMEMFDTGNVEYIKKTPDLIKFRLSGSKANGVYNLVRLDGNNWLWSEVKDINKESKIVFAAEDVEDYMLESKMHGQFSDEYYNELLKHFEK